MGLMAHVTFPHDTGLPEDASIHTWNFWTGLGVLPEVASGFIATELLNFYTEEHGEAVNTIQQYMTRRIDWEAAYLTVWDSTDPEPRVPVYQDLMGFEEVTHIQNWDLPSEVALCLSSAAAAESGVNAARRRGRVYIGPLNGGALNQASTGDARPSDTFFQLVRDAGDNLVSVTVDDVVGWAVYSRADNAFRPVVRGWVDNAFDTQRRRGVGPTVRNQFVVA